MKAGSDDITLDCNGRVAPGDTPYNLYVLYDAGWRPKDANARNAFLMTAGGSPEKLLYR